MASHITQPGERVDFTVQAVDLDLSVFNVLVADCEGCFCEIFKSFKEVRDMELIVLEEDAKLGYECEEFDAYVFLREAGFVKVNGAVWGSGRPYHSVWSKHASSMIWSPVYHFAAAAVLNGGPWLALILPVSSSSLTMVLSVVLPVTCALAYLAVLGTKWLTSFVVQLRYCRSAARSN